MSDKFTPGYNRLSSSAVKVINFQVNSRQFDFEENGELDLTKTWAPNLQTFIYLEYRLDEKQFLETIPKVIGDNYFIQLSAACMGTKKQISAKPAKLSSNGNFSLAFPAHSISESLEIYLTVYLDFEGKSQKRPVGAATRRYSILNQQVMKIRLVGQEPQITIYLSEFAESHSEKALWDIRIDLPTDIDSWIDLEQNDVISIRINSNLGHDFLKERNHLTLLMADLITINLSKFMDNEEAYDLLLSDVRAGGWVSFARSNSEAIFKGDAFPKQTWLMSKEQIQRRIQHYASSSVERIMSQFNTGTK